MNASVLTENRQPETYPQLLTCEQVAQVLNVGTDWVRRKVQRKEIEHVRLGRNVRFTDEQVQALIRKYTR